MSTISKNAVRKQRKYTVTSTKCRVLVRGDDQHYNSKCEKLGFSSTKTVVNQPVYKDVYFDYALTIAGRVMTVAMPALRAYVDIMRRAYRRTRFHSFVSYVHFALVAIRKAASNWLKAVVFTSGFRC